MTESDKEHIQVLRDYNRSLYLSREIEYYKKILPLTGLHPEELQGIHGLIQSQIKFIAELQTGNDTHEIVSAVSSLVDLASLVSKPTER